MDVGMCIFNGIEIEDQVKYFKKFGIGRTFIGSEQPDFEKEMQILKENGIICESLHAPYSNINDMWGEDEAAAESILNRLKDSVDKCERHGIPVSVVHVSSGRPMPEITGCGIRRYEELFDYAKKKGVTIALENLRYPENLAYFMDNYTEPGFCWDNGHENCYSLKVKFMELYGDRLSAMHIHDNRCGNDTDDHLLPFDGNIDFEYVAKALADSNYKGALMLEIGKNVTVDGEAVYGNISEEEYVRRAAEAVKKLADMVESYKKV